MCGIVGVISDKNIVPVTLEGLSRLEYRGYDSAGIAVISEGALHIRKGVGKLAKVESENQLSELKGNIAIGHVRWATHGGVTKANAHPHTDCAGRIAVVHNGIIDNYQELKASLPSHQFKSQTDTEVIAHLIEEYLSNGGSITLAVRSAISSLKGSYALLVVDLNEPDVIIAARKNSPLIVGIGDGSNFIASDALCFKGHTDKVIYVDDGEIVVMTKNSVEFYDDKCNLVKHNLVTLTTDNGNGHKHYMLQEILEQPEAIRKAIQQDKSLVMDIALDILRARQVIFSGSGTSRYAALVGRYIFSKLANKFCDVIWASEFQYFTDPIDKGTLVIAISQSGETADVLRGVKQAKEHGAKVFSVVNTYGSSLSRMSDNALFLKCGAEISVAATKSFIAELSVFYLIAYAMINRIDKAIESLVPLSFQIETNLENLCRQSEYIARTLKNKTVFYYIGRGINFSIAGEGALKHKEVAYVFAEGMSAGELKHGTLALIEDGTPIIAICPADYTYEETIANLNEAKARGAFIVGISDKQNQVFDEWVQIPTTEEIFYPLVSVIPLQLIAYYSAVIRGHDVDRPRNLAKSVTVL